ncbi:acyl-CoA synthetase [Corynebacterium yudongzhengii]|uniref:Acyl-CoA synthetase n=1 Tax=Corynebacterium yudongzhengii TaxID=2080740 RepID=A0A2U1T4P1_9CORY|nr:AMP-binding protein [Corynebacterium yudongzhengii]AWB81112.1 acyl-CoA synthetase [Corynebacterium yudongzhengii]PWC00970.1 acyl-CoA synthetase [Corynebacterium yudongzhengii]
MTTLNPLQSAAFEARSLTSFVPSLFRTGIIDTKARLRDTAALLPNLARYRFTLAREVETGASSVPDRLALIDDDGTLTYRQFQQQAQTLAKYLLSLGLDKLRIGIMARNGRGMLLPMAAKGYAGATMYLLNVGSSADQLLGSIEENDINVLFIDDEFAERIPDRPGTLPIIAHTSEAHPDELTIEKIVRHPEAVQEIRLPVFPDHGDIVLMSSGTTGIPKGVVRPEPKLPVVLQGIVRAIPIHADQRVQMTASMFHTWGWAMTNVVFAARNTVVTQRVFDPEKCFQQIEKYRCDGLFSSPIFFKQMLQLENQKDYDTSSLKYLASSGHALTPALVEEVHKRFGKILCNIYGSTELTLAAGATAEEIAADPTIAGEVSAGTRLKILDDDGNEVPNGEVGRIFLRNSTSLTGYTNPNIPIVRVGDLIQMGDSGYLDEEGRLHVLGRVDDMIIVGGENVYPRSVEEVLEPMPGIRDLTAQGVDDDHSFARIAVWIVREDSDDGRALTENSVRDWVRDRLVEHSIPRDVHFVDELPRNAVGKVVPRFLPN